MSKKHKHRKWQTTPGTGTVSTAIAITAGPSPPALPPEADKVRGLLAQGHSKSALELAKQIHKRVKSEASEAILVDAYLTRIRSLEEHNLVHEAAALQALVRERYPSARPKLDAASTVLAVSECPLEELLRLLADPALSREDRTQVERAIKRRVTDLSFVAQCPVLPSEHPLRSGSAALEKAFVAVTTGPVTDDQLALPEVPYRSPLAPWKMLVRAIASFYRRDDAAGARYLRSIDPDSAPARFVPVLDTMLSGRPDPKLKPAAVALIHQTGGGMQILRAALRTLDTAFADGWKTRIFSEIQNAVTTCKKVVPELVERLKQHISIRAVAAGLNHKRVQAAMSGASLKDAYFWLLFARVTEDAEEPLSLPACSLWEQFRVHAVHEGWFPREGPEVATLYLHMAELLDRLPREALDSLRNTFGSRFPGYAGYYLDQPPAIRAAIAQQDPSDRYYLFPEQLYQRACAMDPHPAAFARWLEWAKEEPHWKRADDVAEAWHRAIPADVRPLLHLAESTEKRGALKKAIGFLERAESVDSVNAEVRRARMRLLISGAMRHLQQRKPHLAERELVTLESLPQARENDRPAFLAALRWACCRMRGDGESASNELAQASRGLNSEATAIFLVTSVAVACGLSQQDSCLPDSLPLGPADSLAAAVSRACAIGDDIGVPFGIPLDWEKELIEDLSQDVPELNLSHLRALAEAALRRDRRELAYLASAAGLERGGPTEARFLLLRARSLPEWEFGRRRDCLAAAADLARRQRDMQLVGEAVELRRGHRGPGTDFFDYLDSLDEPSLSISSNELNAVLEREKAAHTFPDYHPAPFDSSFGDFLDDVDEEPDSEDDDFGELSESNLSDEVVRLLKRVARNLGQKKQPRKKDAAQDDLF